MISMNLELINPHMLKILIAVKKEDSINALSHRIKLSYGWTYKWVKELADKEVFRLTRMRIYLNKDNEFYKKTINYIKQILCKDIKFYYEVLSLFGIKYCFTKTDSVFVWTKGGYNIGRYRDFYPIFIKIKKEYKDIFEDYCKRLNLKINAKKGIFYQPYYLNDFDIDYCEDIPVDSLDNTIKFMHKYIYNFEPALEMIKEMYNKKIKVKYKEVEINV